MSANDGDLFASQYGFDCGICLWNACNAQALHNTVYTANNAETFSSIEWRFPNTQAVITNNLVNHQMRERDATATQSGNLTTAVASWFVDPAIGDLHLLPTALDALDQVTVPAAVSDDMDGDFRPIGAASDVGADEYGDPPPAAVTDLRVTDAITATGGVSITLRWSPPTSAISQTIRYSSEPITESNWESATLLTDELCGCAEEHHALVPYLNGTLYFAQKSFNVEGGWSAISNNAFWPSYEIHLPVLFR
jgi:hypothetical protein